MTIVRAVMILVGDSAQWLPRWVDRILPEIDVEGEHLRLPRPSRGRQALAIQPCTVVILVAPPEFGVRPIRLVPDATPSRSTR